MWFGIHKQQDDAEHCGKVLTLPNQSLDWRSH